MGAPGLRDRKKLQTRARIAEAALNLFAANGFDQTTVAEVAQAADVSVKTVFNYFPAKEDLFFDRTEEVERLWLQALADRGPGESILAGLRRWSLSRFADHPDGINTHFLTVMAGSALLRGRGQQMWAAHEDAVAVGLADLLHLPPTDPTPVVLAHHVFGIHPLALRKAQAWATDGLAPDQVREQVRRLIDRAYDLLDTAVAQAQPSR